jgi:hypothetical protein
MRTYVNYGINSQHWGEIGSLLYVCNVCMYVCMYVIYLMYVCMHVCCMYVMQIWSKRFRNYDLKIVVYGKPFEAVFSPITRLLFNFRRSRSRFVSSSKAFYLGNNGALYPIFLQTGVLVNQWLSINRSIN